MKSLLKLVTFLLLVSNIIFAQQSSSDFPKLTGPYLGQKPPGICSSEKAASEHQEHSALRFSPKDSGHLFITGGFKEREVYSDVYSIPVAELLGGKNLAWRRGPSLPKTLQGHTAVIAGNRIVIAGGLSGFDETRRAIYSHDVFSADTRDPHLGEWKKEKPLPHPLAYHAAVICKDFIILSGGQSPATISTVYRAPIAENGEIGDWETAGALPKPTRGHASVIVNDRLFILGGHDDRGFFADVCSAPVSIKGEIGKWECATPLPLPLVHFGAAEHSGRIYIFGGQDTLDNLHSENYSAEVSGAKLWNWRKETPFPLPQSRMGVNIINERIIITGGGFGWAPPVYSGIFAAEIGQDGALGKWQKIGDLPGPRAFHSAIIVPERRQP